MEPEVKPMRMLSMFTLASAAIAFSACGGGGGAVSCKDKATQPTYAANVEPIVKGANSDGKCIACHSVRSKDRKGAGMSANYDTYEQFKAVALEASERVGNKTMPPRSEPTLTAAEIETIQQWAACGQLP